jgi:hypothetical protein
VIATPLAFVINDKVRNEIPANQSRASLFNNMGDVFVFEIS